LLTRALATKLSIVGCQGFCEAGAYFFDAMKATPQRHRPDMMKMFRIVISEHWNAVTFIGLK